MVCPECVAKDGEIRRLEKELSARASLDPRPFDEANGPEQPPVHIGGDPAPDSASKTHATFRRTDACTHAFDSVCPACVCVRCSRRDDD